MGQVYQSDEHKEEQHQQLDRFTVFEPVREFSDELPAVSCQHLGQAVGLVALKAEDTGLPLSFVCACHRCESIETVASGDWAVSLELIAQRDLGYALAIAPQRPREPLAMGHDWTESMFSHGGLCGDCSGWWQGGVGPRACRAGGRGDEWILGSAGST